MSKIFLPKVSDVILWLLWEKFSPSLSFSLSLSFSHLHRRLIRSAISAGVTLTVCCSFPSRCRSLQQRARPREGSIYNRQWEKERKKKKYYRNGQSHHLSHVCTCRLTCESILSTNIHEQTRTNHRARKMLSNRAHIDVCNKKEKRRRSTRERGREWERKQTMGRHCVILVLFPLALVDERALSQYFE